MNQSETSVNLMDIWKMACNGKSSNWLPRLKYLKYFFWIFFKQGRFWANNTQSKGWWTFRTREICSTLTSTCDLIISSGISGSSFPLNIVVFQQYCPTSGRIEWRISAIWLILANFDGPPSSLDISWFNHRLYCFFNSNQTVIKDPKVN